MFQTLQEVVVERKLSKQLMYTFMHKDHVLFLRAKLNCATKLVSSREVTYWQLLSM
jgi:hypothetical protein